MTKIRFISLLICFVLLLMSVVGCQEEYQGEYVALEVGAFDATDGGNHASEFELWNSEKANSHQDPQAPTTATVTFNGVTYSGNYRRSLIRVPNQYVSHRYIGDKVFFEISDEDGTLSQISFVYEVSRTGKMSQEQCKEIADAIADDYISLSEYELDVSVQDHSYTFSYYREIGGFRTTDSLWVAVDKNGRISSFGKKMLGSFEDIESVSIDEKKAQDAIVAKLDTIYQGNTKRKGYEILDVILIKLEDDTCALLYTTENRFEDENVSYGSLTKLLLKTFQKGKEK